MEWFQYNLQRPKHNYLDPEILKTIFIRGKRDDFLDALNLLGNGDISQEPFAEIIKLCLRCSRASSRGIITIRDAFVRIQKSADEGVTKAEIGNLF